MGRTKKLLNCNKCRGSGIVFGVSNGYIEHECIFCNGTGTKRHASRPSEAKIVTAIKICEDYVKGKKDGWYH
tara:strand:+ start:379 stop:594 length:216 start_codon:yes stop_codon:yes gene_type:complete